MRHAKKKMLFGAIIRFCVQLCDDVIFSSSSASSFLFYCRHSASLAIFSLILLFLALFIILSTVLSPRVGIRLMILILLRMVAQCLLAVVIFCCSSHSVSRYFLRW